MDPIPPAGDLIPVASTAQRLQPLLKWAGGKRQLLPRLRPFYPARFNQYIEPFFGSGAVFFDLHAAGRLRGRPVVLIDSNADLIGCYEMVRTDCEEVSRRLDELARAHGSTTRYYYLIRDSRFNPLRDALRGADGRIAYTPELAAMLIYLNRTGFNGLFRLNASGGFNVPTGRYARPSFVNRDRLRRVAEALSAPNVTLRWGSFDEVRDIAEAGDFLYCDPPYAPISRTSNFTSYTGSPFDRDDQERLQRLVVDLAERGCQMLLSNSTAREIAALYTRDRRATAAGLRAFRVPARRAINSNAARRGAVHEYLITNIAGPRAPSTSAAAGRARRRPAQDVR